MLKVDLFYYYKTHAYLVSNVHMDYELLLLMLFIEEKIPHKHSILLLI